ETVNEAKGQVTESYQKLDEYFNKLEEAANKNKHVAKEKGNKITPHFIGKVTPELKEAFPSIPEDTRNVSITKIKDDQGRDAYQIKGIKFNTIVSSYEQSAPTSNSQVIDDDLTNSDSEYTSESNTVESQRAEANAVQALTGEK